MFSFYFPDYTVTIELDNGFSNRYTVDADTLFLLVDLPNSNTYSVSVMAVNGAGVGLTGTPPRPGNLHHLLVVPTVQQTNARATELLVGFCHGHDKAIIC